MVLAVAWVGGPNLLVQMQADYRTGTGELRTVQLDDGSSVELVSTEKVKGAGCPNGFYRVQPDEEGVVLRFGAFHRTAGPGLNYHIPWPVETVLTPRVTT